METLDKSTMTDDKRAGTRVACISLLSLAIVSLTLRCYTRIFVIRGFGWDDGLMVVAGIFLILFVAFTFLGTNYVVGIHVEYLTMEDLKTGSFYFFMSYHMYALTMVFSKASICIYLLRIVVKKWDIWILYSNIAVTTITAFIFCLMCILQCKPVAFFWDKSLGGTCWNTDVLKRYIFFLSAVSVVSDFTCAILPMFLIWKLKMTMRTKIALVPIMLMACVGSSAVAVRFAYLPLYGSRDFFYTVADIVLWTVVEAGLAITAGSLATLRPLVIKVAKKLGVTRSRDSTFNSSRQPNESSSNFPLSNKNSSRNKPSELYGLASFAEHGQDDAGGASSTSEFRTS